MPSPATITAFYTFAPLTSIKSAEVNNNFALMRGHLLPLDASTTAFANHAYDLGSESFAWRGAHSQFSNFYLNTAGSVPATPASGRVNLYFKDDGLLYKKNSSGTETEVGGAAGAEKKWSTEISNLGIDCTIGSNALTIILKDGTGASLSASSPAKVAFRDATAAIGSFNQRSYTSVIDMTISSGSTLGHVSGSTRNIFVYLIDSTTTGEMAISSAFLDDGTIVSTTAEGGAGAADANSVVYSRTARANVPIRCIGRMKSTQATAGTWATKPAELSTQVHTFNRVVQHEFEFNTHAGYGSTATKVPYFTNQTVNQGTAMSVTTNNSTDGCQITINEPGLYAMTFSMRGATNGEDYIGLSLNASSGATAINSLAVGQRLCVSGGVPVTGNSDFWSVSTIRFLNASDIIRPHTTTATVPGAAAQSHFRIVKLNANSPG